MLGLELNEIFTLSLWYLIYNRLNIIDIAKKILNTYTCAFVRNIFFVLCSIVNWSIQCLTTWIGAPLSWCKDDLFLTRIVSNHCLFLKNSDNRKDSVVKYNNCTCSSQSHIVQILFFLFYPCAKNTQGFFQIILI